MGNILNDRAIKEYVSNGLLIEENFDEKFLTPNGYDLRVGEVMPDGEISNSSPFFASSLETIRMPDNVVASMYIKSRYARRSVFSTFGFVDAGFHGNLTLSFINFGTSLILKKGDPIVQIIFSEIEPPEKNYSKRSGNFQNSHGINTGNNK